MTKTYDKCPRCGGNWKLSMYDSKNNRAFRCDCGMGYTFGLIHDHILAITINEITTNPTKGHEKLSDKLGWFIDEHKCRYGNLEQLVNDAALELPWLDFSITIEEVRKLVEEKK
jgi:hypothetical protein